MASIIYAQLQIDSDTAVNGTAHSGSGWERLTVTTVGQNIGTSIKFGLRFDNDAGSQFQAYADEAILTAGYSEAPRGTGDLLLRWREAGDNILFEELLAGDRNFAIEGRGLDRNFAIEGRGLLTAVSSGTNTMEIDESNKRLLYAYAGMEFFQGDQHTENQGQFNQLERRLSRLQQRINSGVGGMASQPVRRAV